MADRVDCGRRGLLRQGDILLVQAKRVPRHARLVEREAGRLVLARGEATGHLHAVSEPDAELRLSADDRLFLVVHGIQPASFVHEEHATILVPPGRYEVRRQREYVPAVRRRARERWVSD